MCYNLVCTCTVACNFDVLMIASEHMQHTSDATSRAYTWFAILHVWYTGIVDMYG